MSQQSSEIQKIFKSRQVILDLLYKQGYDTGKYTGSSITEVSSMYITKQMDMLLEKTDKKTYVKYHLDKTLRPTNLYDYIEDLINLDNILKKTDDLVIIIKDEPNDSLKKTLANFWQQDGVFINVINIKRLQFNILNHELVPPHKVLSTEEADAVKKLYNIMDDSQIPDISRFSPVSQVIGIRPGQMCEIIRPSKTAIQSKFYRVCSP
jgi:DNA-directed RNA polymerase subunit H (RpoH/RPB5)|tara:strand:- start:5995 stop:6618 length:624 start_codon:yes stop_codon:yes gene_type:complete